MVYLANAFNEFSAVSKTTINILGLVLLRLYINLEAVLLKQTINILF